MQVNQIQIGKRPVTLRIMGFVLCLAFLWLPIATPIYLLIQNDPNLVTILTMGLLAIAFLVLLPGWSKLVHNQDQAFRYYGLEFSRLNGVELIKGLAIGLTSIQLLFLCEAALGWLEWQPSTTPVIRWIIEAIPTAFGVPLAEELFFRGWMFDEIERDYNSSIAIWSTSIIFAAAHFIKPIPEIIRTSPQFLGLLLLALLCAWGKKLFRDRLGLPIGIHAGLLWGWYVVNVGNLIKYPRTVPDWVTGVNDNPLAGLMGAGFMFVLVVVVRNYAVRTVTSEQ